MNFKENAELLEQKIYDTTTNELRKINKIYKEKVTAIEKEISYFITKYATENGLTYAEASKNLTKIEKSDYNKQLKELSKEYKKTGSEKLLTKIKELEMRSTITRLDALKNQIELRVALLTEDIINEMRYHLENLYREVVETTDKDTALLLGVDRKFDILETSAITAVLTLPLSGLVFNERVWKCTDKLMVTLIETLQSGLVQNKKAQEIAKDIKEKVAKNDKYSSYDIERVVKTESQLMLEKGKNDVFVKYGIKEYMIITAKDERTCRRCSVHHEEIISEEDYVPRVTAPPFHPLCRCYTVIMET